MGGVAKGRVVPIPAQDHDDRSRLRAVFEVFGEPSDHRPDEASSEAAQGKVIVARGAFSSNRFAGLRATPFADPVVSGYQGKR